MDATDNQDFRKELDEKMEAHDVDPRAVQSYDEYNDFYHIPRKTTIVAEEHESAKGTMHKRHVHSASGGRRSLTVAVTYGPFHKGPAMVMVDNCAQETIDLINQDLGKNNMEIL